mgnify:CR=1 FL=1
MEEFKEMEEKIAVISGAGISAESGLKTFRDDGGLWRQYAFTDLASPEAWRRQPEVVLEFYNERRRHAHEASPNPAHRALARLEDAYEVTIVTQNVDALHERAGSGRVLHLHGELAKARSCVDESLVYEIGGEPIRLGDTCEKGGQLRPHVVWFGEPVMAFDRAIEAVSAADKVLVVGTSLSVYPAASLVDYADNAGEKVLVTREVERPPTDFQWLRDNAAEGVPGLVDRWLAEAG